MDSPLKLIRFLEALLGYISNMAELKIFGSAVHMFATQSSASEAELLSPAALEWRDAQTYLRKALQKAIPFCKDSNTIAAFKVLLEYYRHEGILDAHEYYKVDNQAEVNRMGHAPFIVEMKQAIELNAKSIESLQGSVKNLQVNFQIMDSNVRSLRKELHSLKSAMRRQLRIQGCVGVMSAFLNVATFGVGGTLLQAFDALFNSIVDLSNTSHIRAIVMKSSTTSLEAQESFEDGMEAATKHIIEDGGNAYADSILEKELEKKPSPLYVLGMVCVMSEATIDPSTSVLLDDNRRQEESQEEDDESTKNKATKDETRHDRGGRSCGPHCRLGDQVLWRGHTRSPGWPCAESRKEFGATNKTKAEATTSQQALLYSCTTRWRTCGPNWFPSASSRVRSLVGRCRVQLMHLLLLAAKFSKMSKPSA